MPDNIITPEDFVSPEERVNTIENKDNSIITPEDFSSEINTYADMTKGVAKKGFSIDQASELFRLTGRWQADDSAVNREGQLAHGQSGWEQFNNFLGGSSANFAAGFLDNFNYDIPDMAGLVAGEEREYGNWLSDITKDLRDHSEEGFPIYEEGDDFGTPQYWAKFGKNMSFSVGLVTGTLLEQAALAALTGGSGNVGMGIAKAVSFGAMKGIQEGYINGLETFESAKAKYLELGYDEEGAITNAAKAASLAYKMEVGPLMALNTLQFATIGKFNPFVGRPLHQGFSGAVTRVAERALPEVNSKLARGAIGYGVNMVSEGFEEGYQTYVSKFGIDSALKESGDKFIDFNPWDREMFDSILAGFAMGGVFKAGGDAVENMRSGRVRREHGAEQDRFIAGAMTSMHDDLGLLRSAQESKDLNKIQSALYRLERGNVFRALNLDHINQRGTIAFDSHVNAMQQALDAVEEGNPETLQKLNLTPEDVSYVRDNYAEAIQDAHTIKDKLTKNLTESQDYEIAALTTDSEFLIEKSIREQNKASQNVQDLKKQNPLYENLSSDGKRLLDLEVEKEALDRYAIHTELVPTQKEQYDKINNEIKELREKSYDDKSKDYEVLDVIGREEMLMEESYKLSQQRLQRDATDRYKKYTSKEYQKKLKEKRRARLIERADSVQELEQVITDQTLTEEEVEVVEAKLEDARIGEEEKRHLVSEETEEERKLRFFRKEINAMSDDLFMSTSVEMEENLVKEIGEISEILYNDQHLNSDVKSEIGKKLKLNFTKIRDIQNRYGNIEYSRNEPIVLTEKTRSLEHNERQQELEEILNNNSVDILSNGKKYKVRGKTYYNLYSDIVHAINRDENNNIVSVTLNDETNNKKTFKSERLVDALAYDILITKTAELENNKKEKIPKVPVVSVHLSENELKIDLHQILNLLSVVKSNIETIKYEYNEIGYTNKEYLEDPNYQEQQKDFKELTIIKDNLLAQLGNIKNYENDTRKQIITENEESIEEQKLERSEQNITTETNESVKTESRENLIPSIEELGDEILVVPTSKKVKVTPSVITNSMRQQLLYMGYKQEEIDKLQPEEANKILNQPDELLDTDISFEPKILIETTPEQNQKIKDLVEEYVRDLKNDLGHQPTFMEFVEDAVETMGKTTTDENWNALIKGWELNNYQKPKESFNAIWQKLFRDKKAVGRDITSWVNEATENFIPEQLPEEKRVSDKDLVAPVREQNKIVETDENGQPSVYNDNPYVATTPSNKLSFKSLASKSTKTVDKDGNVRLNEEDASELLLESADINHKKLLNTKEFKVGEKLIVKIPDNWQDIRVTEWIDDVTKASTAPLFKELYQGDISDILNNQTALDKIPLVIVDESGEAVAFVTDVEWYNPKNVKSDGIKTASQIIEEGRINTRNIRRKLFENPNRELEIEITERSTGHMQKLGKDQPKIPINEANPQSMIGIATDVGDIRLRNNKYLTDLGIDLVNKETLKPGMTYDLREVHDGKYVALSVTREKLLPEAVNNIIWATRIKLNHKTGKYDSVKNEIAREDTYGLNLYEFDNLNKYVSRYVRTSISDDIFDPGDQDADVSKKITAYFNNYEYQVKNAEGVIESRTLPVGTPYIIAKNFKFYIGRVGQKIKGDSQTVYIGTEENLPLFEGVLRDMKLNSNVEALTSAKDTKMFSFSTDGQLIQEKISYEDYLKDNLKTNVKSFNVGTEANPNYATFIQPIINYAIADEIAPRRREVIEEQENPVWEVEEPVQFRSADISQEVEAVIDELQPYSTETLTEEEKAEHEDLQKALSTLPGLQRKQQIQIVEYLFHMINKAVDPVYKNITNKAEILNGVKAGFYEILNKTKVSHQEVLDKARNSDLSQEKLQELEKAMQIYDVVDKHFEALQQIALQDVLISTGLEETLETTEKGFQESITENGKLSASYVLKRFLSGIKKTNKQGGTEKGFLGIPTFIPYGEIFDSLSRVMTAPSSVGSDYDLMIRRLKEHSKSQKHLEQVVDYLENGTNQALRNAFVYNFAKHGASFEMVLWSKLRSGDYEQKVLRANSKEITQIIRNAWKSNLYSSPLVRTNNGVSYISKEVAKDLYTQFLEIASNPKETSNEVIKDWIASFGISISDGTLNELRDTSYKFTNKDGKVVTRTFEQMFENSPSTFGIFGLLGNYLKTIQTKENTEFEEKPSNDPFTKITKALKILSNIESKYTQIPTTNTFRDGQKNVSGILQSKHTTDVVDKLKMDESFRDILSSKSYNKHSLVLQVLGKDANFRELYNVNHIAITSIKENGKANPEDHSVTSLPERDYMAEKAGFFFNTDQGTLSEGTVPGIPSRISRMMFPTMSDKTQMLNLSTIALDLRGKDTLFTVNKGQIELSENVLEVIYSQLVKPDLERIYNYHKRGTKSNILGYDTAAQLFLSMPELNNIRDKNGDRAISRLKKHSTNTIERFEEDFKQEIKEYLQKIIQDKTSEKYQKWSKSFLNDKGEIQFLHKKYFDKLLQNNTSEEALRIGAMDYVVNYMIHNANTHMTLSGDIALYANPKIASKFVEGDPTKPKKAFGESVYQDVSRSIDDNVGKRLANLLAPGDKISGSKNDEYIQIFLKDSEGMSSNIKYLTRLLDGKEITDKQIERIKNGENLKKDFPKSNAYFSNATTDAQEYTTVKEHLDILHRLGRIEDNIYNDLLSKSKKEDYKYTDKELKIILQPLKPVYTGFVNDSANDLMRMMYIKSSSFPLLPQVTKGLELDSLRVAMEQLQKEKKKNIRASYQTANKVGSTSVPINMFSEDGGIRNVTSESLLSSSVVLPRDSFRIQQDVPFKSGKRSEDVISLGTQVVKLLLGDGVTDMDGFNFNGEDVSGKELLSRLNISFIDYINLKTKGLLEDFSKDENGNFTDLDKGIYKIQELLKKEAVERGYPLAEVRALELESVKDSSGKTISFSFKRPIWLSNNADRYESLLNAIVTNRLAKIKLPGNSYVAGSEAGFRQRADFTGVDKSKIIYTDKWKGELRAAEIVDGQLVKTQVFLPSKFRDNAGNLINFFDGTGKPNSQYIEKDANGNLVFKKDMIDERLLNLTTFRIPTSSHVSMAQVEIVGLLPYESGDLMIVPKNLTTQKGLDFDIDKENTYQLWTQLGSGGKIGVLENIEEPTEAEKLKLIENDIVKIHSSVLSNPSPEMQKKISSVLSMDFAEGQANLIENTLPSDTNSDFTPLDDQHQDDALALGAAGKLGIGVYSNYVVFHSLVQQSLSKNNRPITLQREGENNINEDISITIGRLTSDGTVGGSLSLRPNGISQERWNKIGRSITEVFAERQNTATDNAKAKIMGRVNINEVTINVDSIMSLLGFDKDFLTDGTEVSIPYLLLSQPIIREYVKLIKQSKSSLTDFDIAAKDKIINSLKAKYKKSSNIDENMLASSLTGQKLFENLNTVDNNVQAKVLDIFLNLEGYATKLGELQNKLNITNGGLGKSFFETVNKFEYLSNFQNKNESGSILANTEDLIGDFQDIRQLTPESIEAFLDLGYKRFGNNLILPETVAGVMLVNTVHTGYNLWADQFVSQEDIYQDVEKEILLNTIGEDPTDRKKIKTQERILKEFKKFLYTSEKLNLFTRDVTEVRERLFIDKKGHDSLATYLNDVVFSESLGKDILLDNPLIAGFTYNLKRNGQPSLIEYSSTNAESSYEAYLYEALIELYLQNKPLPNFNGEFYTTKDLAEDLVAYSYVGEPVQEGIQFLKYVPIEYLDKVGATSMMQHWNTTFKQSGLKNVLGQNTDTVSNFTEQFLRHNPNLLYKADEDFVTDKKYSQEGDTKTLMSFNLDTKKLSPKEVENLSNRSFIAIYNGFEKKGLKKYNIYKQQADGSFNKVSALGVTGMTEYNIYQWSPKSSLYANYQPSKPIVYTAKESRVDVKDTFNLSAGNIHDSVRKVMEYPFTSRTHLNDIAKALYEYIPKDLKLEVVSKLPARGQYNWTTNTISISQDAIDQGNNELLGNTIIHELIHGLTVSFTKSNPNNAEVLKLNALFSEAKKAFTKEDLDAFFKKYKETGAVSFNEKVTLYGMTDLNEFMAVAFEPEFQKLLSSKEYLLSGKSFKEKFLEIIDNILKKVLGANYPNNNLNKEILNTVFSIVEEQSKESNMLNDLFVAPDVSDILPMEPEYTGGFFDENLERSTFTRDSRDKLPEFNLCK